MIKKITKSLEIYMWKKGPFLKKIHVELIQVQNSVCGKTSNLDVHVLEKQNKDNCLPAYGLGGVFFFFFFLKETTSNTRIVVHTPKDK